MKYILNTHTHTAVGDIYAYKSGHEQRPDNIIECDGVWCDGVCCGHEITTIYMTLLTPYSIELNVSAQN